MNDLIESIPELEDASQVCHWLASWKWSEAAGGNFSVRIDKLPENIHNFSGKTPQSLPRAVPVLSGTYMLLTGKGARARDIASKVEEGVGLYWILQGGEEFVSLWGNNEPTSELHAHLAIHEMLLEVRPTHRAILHTHPANLIALTHIPEMRDASQLSDLLLRMQSEARIHLPQGLAYIHFNLPGSHALGETTSQALREANVALWHMHGAIATGESISQALDYLEIVDKAAQIYWRLVSSGIEPSGMTDEHLRLSLEHFGLWERYNQGRYSKMRRQPS